MLCIDINLNNNILEQCLISMKLQGKEIGRIVNLKQHQSSG